MLDIDFGTYPFVTSSSTGAGGCSIGVVAGGTSAPALVGVTYTLGSAGAETARHIADFVTA